MGKKFKSKKKKKFSLILVSLVCLYIIGSMLITTLETLKLTSTNEEFLLELMYNANHYLKYEKKRSFFTNFVNYVLNIDFSQPLSIVSKTFDYEKGEEVAFMVNTYMEDPNKEIVTSPRVYIYNTHQGEGYKQENYENYGINPGVMMASYLLKEKLNKLGIPTIAEEGNILDFMAVNGYTHADSYVASRYFIEPVIKENNLDLIIDLHRDSLKRNLSTITISNKSYAKVLFVVGLENDNHKENLNLSTALNKIIDNKYPGLSRGILKKEGLGVDGVYNQDMSPKMILLEVGGYENTVSEVNNTLEAISEVIKVYMESL